MHPASIPGLPLRLPGAAWGSALPRQLRAAHSPVPSGAAGRGSPAVMLDLPAQGQGEVADVGPVLRGAALCRGVLGCKRSSWKSSFSNRYSNISCTDLFEKLLSNIFPIVVPRKYAFSS